MSRWVDRVTGFFVRFEVPLWSAGVALWATSDGPRWAVMIGLAISINALAVAVIDKVTAVRAVHLLDGITRMMADKAAER